MLFRKHRKKGNIFPPQENDRCEGILNGIDDTEDTVDLSETETGIKKRDDRKKNFYNRKTPIQSIAVNNKGIVRYNNEDNFYLNGIFMPRAKMDNGAMILRKFTDEVQIYAVCDGMGGTEAGEEASFCAVRELADRRKNEQDFTDATRLKKILCQISDRVYEEAEQRRQKSGTTIAMMVIGDKGTLFANVGDSRIYRFRNHELMQLSLDHSRAQRMIAMGLMTQEEAKKSPGRHVLTQYLGMTPEVQISPCMISDENIQKSDLYLLCSDGLSDMVEDSQIEKILQDETDLENSAKRLLETAIKNGGRDNVTIMLVQI